MTDTHPGSEKNHLMGCTKPGQKIEDGCMDSDHGHTSWGHDNRKKADLNLIRYGVVFRDTNTIRCHRKNVDKKLKRPDLR